MKRLSFVYTVAGLLLAAAAQGQTASGFVYEDINNNGFQDSNEEGIEGVIVSNEVDVTVTNEEGFWELPIPPLAVFSVVKPPDYQVPVNEHNIPQFYYIHRPDGSPNFEYRGVEPTGDLPNSIDFPLIPGDDPKEFRALLFADPQPRDARELDYIRRDVLSEVAGKDAHFVMTLGDILFDNLNMFTPWKEAIGRLGIPAYHVVGNHDINFDAPSDDLSSETYISHFGPENYAFTVSDMTFIVMDNIVWNGDGYATGFNNTQIQWLIGLMAELPEDQRIVIATHAPLVNPGNRRTGNLKALLEAVANSPNVLAVNGHTHYVYHYSFSSEDNWRGFGTMRQHNIATVSGSWWSGPTNSERIPEATQRDGTPNGYVWLDVNEDSFKTIYKGAGLPEDEQMRLYLPGTSYRDESVLLVNVFDGMPDGEVDYRIDGGEWSSMEFTPQRDPVAREYYDGPNKAGNTWIGAVNSQHIWEAPIKLERNETYRVDVRYSDDMEREFNESIIVLHR